jgi:hypothetical protein
MAIQEIGGFLTSIEGRKLAELDQILLNGSLKQLSRIADTRLLHDSRTMRFDGLDADVQSSSNLAIGEPFPD